MKNLIITFLSLMVLSSTAVFAEGIEVLPTMQSRTNAQDRVWVGTFQLVWNDFVNKVIHIPVGLGKGLLSQFRSLINKPLRKQTCLKIVTTRRPER